MSHLRSGSARRIAIAVVSVVIVCAAGFFIANPLAPKANPADATTASPCSSAQLSGAFWLTPVAQGKQLDGVTVTNMSSSQCDLTGYPVGINMLDQQGDALPPVVLPLGDGSGQSSSTAFVPFNEVYRPHIRPTSRR